MKKAIYRMLARMAKDGDIETAAEIIEEMLEANPEPAAAASAAAAPEETAGITAGAAAPALRRRREKHRKHGVAPNAVHP